MKYFSLFEHATFIKNGLDQAAVDCLKFGMSNLLIDERDVERFERGIRNEILEFSKIFPRYTPIRFECYDNGGMDGVRRYSLSHGPNITFALHPVRESSPRSAIPDLDKAHMVASGALAALADEVSRLDARSCQQYLDGPLNLLVIQYQRVQDELGRILGILPEEDDL